MNRLQPRFFVVSAVLSVALVLTWLSLRTTTAQAQDGAPAQAAATPKPTSGAGRADGGRKGGGAADAIPVIVAPVSEASDGVALELLGSGSARKSVTVFAPVAGEVA